MEAWRFVWAVVWAWMAGIQAAHVKDLPRRDLDRPGRIVGGYQVQRGQYPWQVSIQDSFRGHFCGGTLISESLVVTAAHCTKAVANIKSLRVVTGAYDLNERGINRVYRVVKIIQGDYNTNTLENDISLIQIDTTTTNMESKRGNAGVPVAMEITKDSLYGRNCTISGWGRLQSNGQLPNTLRAAEVIIRSDEDCAKAFNDHTYYKVYPSNLCAGGGERDACQGDSGGPLVCCSDGATRTAEDVRSCRLVGITSWGIGCATRGIPGVYTELAYQIKWIKAKIKEHYGEEEARTLSFSSLVD